MGVDISVLMPVKNAMPYLTECLDSILNQTETNWELIAIDDHSTDMSRAVLQSYADRDNRITCLPNDGKGIIDALRTAYASSSGRYITRMDADDIMSADKLSTLRSKLIIHGAGHLAVGGVTYFSDGELGDGYRRYEAWLNRLTAEGDNFIQIYKECVIPSPCWMLHRDDFEQVGAFDSDVYPEDYDLAFRMYQTGLEVIPCTENLHLWRDYGTRTSRNDPNYADNRFLDLKCHHFLQHDYDMTRSVAVWGAGKKGKAIIKNLQEAYIEELHWITDNQNKIGHDIYDITLMSSEQITDLDLPQIIIAVANDEENAAIQDRLNAMGYYTMIDYFSFC